MNFQIFKSVIAVFLFISVFAMNTAGAQALDKTRYSLEIDPATFALGGYAFHLRVQPKNSEHLIVGLGTYAMDFPSVLVNLNEKNRDQVSGENSIGTAEYDISPLLMFGALHIGYTF